MAQKRFSSRTLAELTKRVADGYSHAELSILLRALDAQGVDEDRYGNVGNKLERANHLVEYLHRKDDAGEGVQELVQELLADWGDRLFGWDGTPVSSMRKLLDLLRADGFEVSDEGRLLATTPDPAAVAPEMSALEKELEARGFRVALRHYQQAVDNFTDRRLEASNGQLRSFLEDLCQEICKAETGSSGNDPKGAIEKLRTARFVDGDEANLFKGLVGVSNERGAHRGLTDDEEALFRLHLTTAAARYLLSKLP